MLLAMDVGNSNIKVGLFEGEKLISSFRITTNADRSSDEYGLLIIHFLSYLNRTADEIEGVIIATVQPQLRYTLDRMTHTFFRCHPIFVSYQLNLGIKLKYDSLPALGADRIANAVAGYELYGGNGACITVDFGTATTFGVISEDGVFLGGSIAPGIRSVSEALTSRAAQLRRFNFAKPDHVLATNTIEAMQAGVMYGFAGLADNILAKLKMEVGPAFVVATGGLSDVIAGDTHHINTVDKLLTLKGLQIIYNKNR